MAKFTFCNKNETIRNFHSESIEKLLQKLASDWLRLFAREEQIQADLTGWNKMLVKIKEVLDGAVEKETTHRSVKIWLGKLQILAYDAEDLLDEFQTEAFQRKSLLGEAMSQPSTSQYDSMAMSKVKEVNARLQDITSQIVPLGLKSRNVGQRLPLTSLVREAKLILAAGRVGGRDPGPAIFSPLIRKPEDLDFLIKDDLVSLEIIGLGGNGDVYKAKLPGSNGMMIAVKKIAESPKCATKLIEEEGKQLNDKMRQIQSEICTAGRIRHKNILPLLAHIPRPDCHLLVYEFMKNGSLQDIVNDVSQERRELAWLDRHRIALGVASGLELLHNFSPCIIHRDLKPGNILVDKDMEARIANFGLAKVMPDANTHITTSYVVGTVGYIAPEYHQTLKITDKCDIYSLGVLLAILVMGKLPSDEFFLHTKEISLVKWMRNVMTSDNPNRAIDSKLLGNGYEEQMLFVLKIACFCTLDDPIERPNSKDVRCMLSQIQH